MNVHTNNSQMPLINNVTWHREPKSTAQRGFSLIEILISVLILSVGVAAVAQLHRQNIDGGIFANQSTIATNLAQKKLAELAPLLSAAPAQGTETTIDSGTTYTLTWTTNEAADGTTRVNVSIAWNGRAGEEPNTIALAAVGQNYTPDESYRGQSIFPIVALPPTLEIAFTSASSSSQAATTTTAAAATTTTAVGTTTTAAATTTTKATTTTTTAAATTTTKATTTTTTTKATTTTTTAAATTTTTSACPSGKMHDGMGGCKTMMK